MHLSLLQAPLRVSCCLKLSLLSSSNVQAHRSRKKTCVASAFWPLAPPSTCDPTSKLHKTECASMSNQRCHALFCLSAKTSFSVTSFPDFWGVGMQPDETPLELPLSVSCRSHFRNMVIIIICSISDQILVTTSQHQHDYSYATCTPALML